MAGLFDIGSSGIQAYRKALSVTGQNIANLQTEGYRRRDASLGEVSAVQSDVTSIADQVGLGVRVENIARAFDDFMVSRVRDTSAELGSADAFKTQLQDLEGRLVPDDYDLGTYLSEFFDGLAGVAQAPGDLSTRTVALEQSRSLASGFRRLSENLDSLRQDIVGSAQLVVEEVNLRLSALAQTQAQIVSSGRSGLAPNATLDELDKQISALAEDIQLSVTYEDRGHARITLGDTGAGPLLLSTQTTGAMGISAEDGRLVAYAGQPGALSITQQVTAGKLAGLQQAYETVSASIAQLDNLAQVFAREMNDVHGAGLTLDGLPGGALFSTDAYAVTPAATNLGQVTATVDADPNSAVQDLQLRLSYDRGDQLWKAFDAEGAVVAQGATGISYAGLDVVIAGSPADGDEFTLTSSTGKAANLQFLLTRGEDFAAAAAMMVTGAVDNLSDAVMQAQMGAPIASSGLADVTQVLGSDLSAVDATRLRSAGVVGVVPANVQDLSLASLMQQSTVSFAMDDAQAAGVAALQIRVDGTVHEFAMTNVMDADLQGAEFTLENMANWLNQGALRSAADASFADLGLYASANGGTMTIVASVTGLPDPQVQQINSATVLLADGVTQLPGAVRAGLGEGAQIQVFTREGRHVAGSALTQAQVLDMLRGENGFLPGAEYRADYLNAADGDGYRGMSVTRTTPAGDFSASLYGLGFTSTRFDADAAPITLTPKAQLMVEMGGQMVEQIDIPAGVSAGYIAQIVNEQARDNNITAQAQTHAMISDVGAGLVAFQIEARDGSWIELETIIPDTGNLSNLAVALNAQSAQTGFTAVLSPDGARVMLSSAEGDDLALQGLTFDVAGAGMAISAVDEAGLPLRAAVLLDGTELSAMRMAGEVTLSSSAEFTARMVNLDTGAEGEATSATDSFRGGMLARQIFDTGLRQSVSFALSDAIDGNARDVDGAQASAASGSFAVDLGADGLGPRLTAQVDSIDLPALDSATIGAQMVKSLRAQAPLPSMLGAPFAASDMPPEDTQFQVMLGDQTYTLTLNYATLDVAQTQALSADDALALRKAGAHFTISGGGIGDLSAQFEKIPGTDQMQLRLSAQDGSLTGQSLRLDGADDVLTAFGLRGAGTDQITTSGISPVADTPYTISLEIDGVTQQFDLEFQYQNSAGDPIDAADLEARLVLIAPSLPANMTATFTLDTGSIDTGSLQIASTSGAVMTVAPDVATAVTADLGLQPPAQQNQMLGRAFAAQEGSLTINVTYDAVAYDITVTHTADPDTGALSQSITGLPAGLALTDRGGQLEFTYGLGHDLTVQPGADAAALGLRAMGMQLSATQQGMDARSLMGQTVDLHASAASLASEQLHLSGLPDEELIIMITGTGAKRLAADIAIDPNPQKTAEDFEIKIIDAAAGRVEIIDRATGASMASRTVDDNGRLSALGLDFSLSGGAQTGDVFYVRRGTTGAGDGRNMDALLALQYADGLTGKGGYHDGYGAMIASVGSKVQAAMVSHTSAEALHNAAIEADDAFAGVNLDTEAARLIEQQQAYQAVARVLSTAKELLDTLMNAI